MSVADTPRAVSAEGVLCTHCGLPVPAALVAPEPPQFCCSGCQMAYQVLHDAGLERYYDMSERRNLAVAATGRAYDEFDHEAFQQLWVRTRVDGLRETDLYLEGVHCASCVWLVERTPIAVPGVASAELDLSRGIVRLAWDPRDRHARVGGALPRHARLPPAPVPRGARRRAAPQGGPRGARHDRSRGCHLDERHAGGRRHLQRLRGPAEWKGRSCATSAGSAWCCPCPP